MRLLKKIFVLKMIYLSNKANVIETKFQEIKNPLPLFIFGLLIVAFLVMGSWYVSQGSIYFFTDIARDFLLFEEIQEKTIVLLGPRASGMEGVFHGPLWLYINMPAFLLGSGNPVLVGWFWVLLTSFFIVSVMYSFSKEISWTTTLVFATLLSGLMVRYMNGLFNPFGALFALPFLFLSGYKYLKTSELRHLIIHLLVIGLVIQFQMAIGVPLFLLSAILVLRSVFQKRHHSHLYSFLILLIPLSTFIIFEFRHDFAQFRSALNFLLGESDVPYFTYLKRLEQRFNLATSTGLYLFHDYQFDFLNRAAGILVAVQLTANVFKLSKKDLELFHLAAYYFFGFYFVSLMFNGMLLFHYWIVMVPVAFFMISLIIGNLKLKLALPILAVVIGLLLNSGLNFIQQSSHEIGQIEDDWKFQTQLAQKIFSGDEDKFGYFIFTPDIYAYESKYALSYWTRKNPEKEVSIYEKEPVTYIVVAPVPEDRPDIKASDWKRDRVGINRSPDREYSFPDNYIIEKYYLSDDEIGPAKDPNIHDWVHFR